MATIALGVAFAEAGILGGIIAGVAGAVIDQYLIYPAIFGGDKKDIEGPRLQNITLTTASEGAPVNFMMGDRNRVGGTIIWISDLIEEVTEEESGGKGGGGPVIRSFRYFANIAIAVGDGEAPLSGIKRIWANSHVIYRFHDGPTTVSAANIGVEIVDYAWSMKIYTLEDDVDLTDFRAGGLPSAKLETSGFFSAGNNTTDGFILYEKWEGNKGPFPNDPATGSYLLVANDSAVTEVPNANNIITLEQTVPDFLQGNVEDVRIYLGDQTTADDLIESFEDTDGLGIPAFTGTAYVVLQKLALADSGNAIPNFTFEAAADPDHVELGTAIDRIIGRIKDKDGNREIATTEVDVTDVDTSKIIHGYTVAGPVSDVRQLEPLMLFGEVRVREIAGQMQFFTGDGTEVAITETDLSCHDFSNREVPPKIRLTDRAGFDLPSEVNVTYQKASGSYDTKSQRYRRIEATTSNTVDIRLPMFMTASQAKGLAKRRLWGAWQERQQATLSLPPKYLGISEGDHLLVPVGSETYEVRVQEITRGNNFVMEIQGAIVGADTTDQDVDVDADTDIDDDDAVIVPPQVQLLILNTAPLRQDHTTIPGFYWAIAALSPQAEWPGASIWRSKDNSEFNLLDFIGTEATMGQTLTALGDVADATAVNYWDRENTIDVLVYNGTLTSRTEIEVLNGQNRVWVSTSGGGEVIGFQNATQLTTYTYRLDTLLRGTRDTQNETGDHAIADTFLVLNPLWTAFQVLDVADIGSTHYFKGVANGAVEDDITQQSSVMSARSIGAFSVIHVDGVRDNDNNLTISWIRRTRALVDPFSGEGTPLLFDQEQYKLEILDAPGGNVLRNIVVDDDTSIEYTTAEQASDGVTPGDPVNVNLWQVSEVTGMGTLKTATV